MLALNIFVIYKRYVKKEMAEVNFDMKVVNGECVKCNKRGLMRVFNSTDPSNCAKQKNDGACGLALGKWKNYISTGSFFLMGAFPLFIIPSKSRPGKAILEWKTAIEEIPWSLILLIGGGVVVAEAFKVTNTSDYIASFLAPLA